MIEGVDFVLGPGGEKLLITREGPGGMYAKTNSVVQNNTFNINGDVSDPEKLAFEIDKKKTTTITSKNRFD